MVQKSRRTHPSLLLRPQLLLKLRTRILREMIIKRKEKPVILLYLTKVKARKMTTTSSQVSMVTALAKTTLGTMTAKRVTVTIKAAKTCVTAEVAIEKIGSLENARTSTLIQTQTLGFTT